MLCHSVSRKYNNLKNIPRVTICRHAEKKIQNIQQFSEIQKQEGSKHRKVKSPQSTDKGVKLDAYNRYELQN